MLDMFKNYPQPDDYKPNNHPKCHNRERERLEIMTGETATHTFDVPFNVVTECSMVEVIYKLGASTVIIKNSSICLDIISEERRSIITCKLAPEDTLLFKNTALNANAQIKFYMADGSVTYSEIYKVRLRDSLDATNRQKMPEADAGAEGSDGEKIALGGYGWTED